MKKTIIYSTAVSILALTAFFAVPTFATDNTDVVDEINITVPISCTMSGTGMTSHTANMSNGSYTPNIGTTTLKVFCNDEEGFAIFAAGYTGDEIGGTNSTKLVNSASQVNNTISTGTATSGDTSNWAMKLATNTSATYAITLDNGFGSYSAVPSSYTKVAHRDSGTDIGTTATGAELTTTYAAFVNQTQPAGTYIGKVIYTLIHPSGAEPGQQEMECESGKICFYPNANDVVGQMGYQAISSTWKSARLLAPNFKRTGYGFAGWSDKYDYATNLNANFYGPNEAISFAAGQYTDPNDGLALYAVWVKSQGLLQNWNGCSSLSIGGVTALTDNRDNDTYAVAKLADGKCWMIENLRLDDGPELSAANTHNPSLPLTNIYDTNSKSNHLSPTSSIVYDATTAPEGWCMTNSSACDDQSRLRTDNTILFTNNTSSNYDASSDVYGYGNYYNWYSATAGHGKYNSSNDSSYTAPGDICPVGWRLPTGKDNTGDFSILDIALGGTGAESAYNTTPTGATMSKSYRAYPNNFTYSGYLSNVITRRNTYGSYWTASEDNGKFANEMVFYDSTVYPGTSSYSKYFGHTIRCVSGT